MEYGLPEHEDARINFTTWQAAKEEALNWHDVDRIVQYGTGRYNLR